MIMNIDQFFSLASGFAGIGWILILIISPHWKRYDLIVIGIVVMLLAVAYSALNFTHFRSDILEKFSTLNGVMELFSSKPLVMAAWCHILAFDLVVAVWIKNNSLQYNISHGLIIPSLIFTCILGPLGFLIYLLTRWVKTENYFAAN
jgi:hypothetical protein